MPRAAPQVLLESIDPCSEEALLLLQQMRSEVMGRYYDVLTVSTPPQIEPLVDGSVFLVARWEGNPVGCAGLRDMGGGVAEVKRMYVAPPFRRRGIARLLLEALERLAAQSSYSTLRLETGIRQPEAIALYESHAFQRIPAYGCHIGDPLSICFEKGIRPN
jgi:GNAT superfamily N-acetyltransferase